MKRKICAALAMMLVWHAPIFGQNYLETLTKRLEPDVEHLRGLTFQRDIEKTFQNAGELLAVLDRELARAYPGEDPQSIKDPDAVGEYVAKLMVEGFDSTDFHALPKVMVDA